MAKKKDPEPIIYTAPDAAAELGRSVSTIHRQAEKAEIGFQSMGGTLLFTHDDVVKLRNYQPSSGPAPRRAKR